MAMHRLTASQVRVTFVKQVSRAQQTHVVYARLWFWSLSVPDSDIERLANKLFAL